VQRTEVLPRDRSLAEKEPAKFAALLIERLQQVRNDRETVEKVMQSINQTKVCTSGNDLAYTLLEFLYVIVQPPNNP